MRQTKSIFHRSLGLSVLVCLVLCLLPSGCQKSSPKTDLTTTAAIQTTIPTTTVVSETTTIIQTEATVPTTTATEKPSETTTPPLPVNPLTGEPLANAQAEGQRPVAIMINNIKIATPQLGISQADLIYEMPVEAGITRMLAVFADVAAVPEIGSIRSARHNYIDLAGGLDAIYVHFGASDHATIQLEQQKTDHVDLGKYSSSYWRDAAWIQRRGLEHSVKTTAARLQQVIAQLKYRTTIRQGQKSAFQFRAVGDFVAAAGDAAMQVSVPYSSYVTATFTYDKATQFYSKGQFGKPHLDMATGQPITFSNLFLLPTRIVTITNSVLQDAQLSKGKGYYVSGGQWQAITWTKGETDDSFVFLDQNGAELLVNTGKSYIGIIPDSSNITFK